MAPHFVSGIFSRLNGKILIFRFLSGLRLWPLAVLSFLILGGAQTQPVLPAAIELKIAPLPIIPKEFYIAEVIDERTDRKAVTYLIPPTLTPAKPIVAQPVDLKGGGGNAVRQFIRQGLRRNTALRPVVVRLKEIKVLETAGASGRVNGQVTINMVFDMKNEGKTVRSVAYKGGARYSRLANQLTVVEPTLRQSLTDGLKFLNSWMERNADFQEELAQRLKITFKDFVHRTDPDTLFYDPKTPLTWNDFRAQPRTSRFSAAVFPSFAYEGESKTTNGVVHLTVTIKVFVVRDASWVRIGRDAYGLNHEQRHFDIVKLVAERFKKKITPENLTVADYNSIMQNQFLDSWREMTRLQEQYDSETEHGINQLAQTDWNQRIDADLVKFGVKQ